MPLPSIAAWWALTRLCPTSCGDGLLARLCEYGLAHPIGLVNALFFLNVCVLFWLISLAQRSAWLIDPYWTILPVLIGHFYATHPLAQADPARSTVALALVWIWSVRLTGSYFRRERWRFGAREDWRFAVKRRESRHFWWYSFFYVFLVQQGLLVGLTAPLWAIHVRPTPFAAIDAGIAALALAGIVIAHVADTQLYRFVAENLRREAAGEPRVELLATGLWRLARHPNYFGEQLFWWALAAYGVRLGEPWVAIGALINTLVLVVVTQMTERRILSRETRRARYEAYRRTTPMWIPWPRRRSGDG